MALTAAARLLGLGKPFISDSTPERFLLASAHMRRIMIHDIIDIQSNNSTTGLISSPEAWKLEGRGLEALRWVDLTRGPNAARFNSINWRWQTTIQASLKHYVRETLSGG